MLRQAIAVLLCATTLLYECGCTYTREVSIDEYQKNPNKNVEKIALVDGKVIEFESGADKMGTIKDEEIIGVTKPNGEFKRFPLSQVKYVYYSEFDESRTSLLSLGIAMVGATLIIMSVGIAIKKIFDIP
jgi:hypothetical protein